MSSVSDVLLTRNSDSGRVPSLAARLTAWYAGSAFLLVLLATSVLYWSLTRAVAQQNDQFLLSKIFVLQKLLTEREIDERLIQEEIAEDLGGPEPIFVRIRTDDGRISYETPNAAGELGPVIFEKFPARTETQGSGHEFRPPSGKSYWVMVQPVELQGRSDQRGVIELAMNVSDDQALLLSYERRLLIVLAISFLMAVAIGYQVARRGLRPLDRVTQTASRIGMSNLYDRILLKGLPAEIRALALAFNNMMLRLQNSFDRLSQFSDDIAHELRTPLQNIMNVSEIALSKTRSVDEYREFLESILENSGRLSRMVQSLIFLARAENPSAEIVRENLDVCHELEHIKEFFDPAASDAQVTITVSCPPGLTAALDRTLIQRAISNLVSNAIAHTAPGGRVDLRANAENGFVQIAVADNGCGISASDLPHVFDRLYRVDATRSAADDHLGLGLSIVKGVARLHGGEAMIESEVERGTTVAMALPIAPMTPRLDPTRYS